METFHISVCKIMQDASGQTIVNYINGHNQTTGEQENRV